MKLKGLLKAAIACCCNQKTPAAQAPNALASHLAQPSNRADRRSVHARLKTEQRALASEKRKRAAAKASRSWRGKSAKKRRNPKNRNQP